MSNSNDDNPFFGNPDADDAGSRDVELNDTGRHHEGTSRPGFGSLNAAEVAGRQAFGTNREIGINPYLPTSEIDDVPVGSDFESIRRAHLNHEVSVKSIRSLYIIGAVLLALAGSLLVLNPQEFGSAATQGYVCLVLAVIQFGTAIGLYALRPWSRVSAVILSLLGLLAFPIGTLFSVYFLYLLLCQKGTVVFSEHYKEVIAATPQVRYKTSKVVWGVLILFLGLISLAVAGALIG
ncbi:hypothetical protein SAMN06265222_107176 [Neorhodopirellula lusitana]|uniref:Uncharacterized protein n=1 Tax=Neorhodopirellula lusitana TaxID=445327 RepID=A0ABY1Q815_9BACT|nr:hypothetical protein [Neorhodopirellula lusitana]SMP61862.1 hypothetical protein SAMN06265222_107176 [Neorhodopirellula lusitana]